MPAAGTLYFMPAMLKIYDESKISDSMKRISVYFAAAAVAVLPLSAQEKPLGQSAPGAYGMTGTISIEECQELARANYPQIRQLELIDASEKYDLSIASSSWIPQLGISGKATWQSEVVEMPFEIPGFALDMPHDQYSITGTLTQHIWDGGVTRSQKDAIKTGTEVQRKQVEVSLYAVRSRVQNVFLGILLLDEQIGQNTLLMESLLRNEDNVKAMIANGMAYQSDLDMVRVNILNCRQQTDALASDREAYVRMLGLLTGKDMSGMDFMMPSEDVYIVRTDVLRPELALYSAQLKQNESRIRQLNSRITPQFDLTLQGGFGRPGLNMLKNGFEPMFIAGVKMQWNIGAFYTRKNDRRKIDTDRRNIELQQNVFLFNTSIDATQKGTAVDKARLMLDKDDEIIGLRSSIREAGEEQYRNGTIRMTDLMDMIDDEHNARLAQSVHRIQLLMAIYDMKNTLGQ